MDPWSNIEFSVQDSEINEIDKFERTLGNIPVHVQQIHELITRFEVCHFKYRQHLSIQDMTKASASIIPNKNDQIKVWLYASLAKTLKEQTGIPESLPKLSQLKTI